MLVIIYLLWHSSQFLTHWGSQIRIFCESEMTVSEWNWTAFATHVSYFSQRLTSQNELPLLGHDVPKVRVAARQARPKGSSPNVLARMWINLLLPISQLVINSSRSECDCVTEIAAWCRRPHLIWWISLTMPLLQSKSPSQCPQGPLGL